MPHHSNVLIRGIAALAAVLAGVSAVSAADLFAEPVAKGHAPSKGGFYAALRGGITAPDDTEFAVGALGIDSVTNHYDDLGGFGTVAAGFGMGGLRLEAELGYFETGIDTHTAVTGGVGTQFDADASFGDLSVVTVMANAYYDIDLGIFAPFVGAGLGIGFVSADEFGVDALVGAIDDGVALDDDDSGFAYQLTAGLGIAVTEQITAEIGYRYQAVMADLEAVTEAESDFDIESHNGFIGVRFGF